jgi:hypothetical protein
MSVPYSDLLEARDPLAVLAETPGTIEQVVHGWDLPRWGAAYGPGKWTAAQVVLHLAHDDITWDLALYRRLTPEQKARRIRQDEFGEISVGWVIRVLAGHHLHHLQHLRSIAGR